nr:MAG TPA: hypothetical protein [Caudoviricetes sp.]
MSRLFDSGLSYTFASVLAMNFISKFGWQLE